MKTLFISDLDGTLLNSKAEISEKTACIINSLIKENLYFTIATARSERTAVPMTSGLDINAPRILMNGVIIYSEGYVKYHTISQENAIEISALFKKHNITGTAFEIKDNKLTVHEKNTNIANPIYVTANTDYNILFPLERDISELDNISHTFYEDTYTGKWFLEVFSDKATKANAIKFLRENYGFERVVCFGDNLNDLTMFNESDVRVAVSNAKKELKETADFITLSNDEDGVAVWLYENYRKFI